MELEDLPSELLFELLIALPTLEALASLIQASPRCLNVFARFRAVILTAVVENQMPPGVIRHALAVINVPDVDSDDAQPLWDYLQSYFDAAPEGLGTTLSQEKARKLAALHKSITSFASHFSGRTLHIFNSSTWEELDARPTDESPGSEEEQAKTFNDLTVAEQIRILRAFYRFQLYSVCFPVEPSFEMLSIVSSTQYVHDYRSWSRVPRALAYKPKFTAAQQFQHFIRHMGPWEIEELCTVHQYFTSNLCCLVEAYVEWRGMRLLPMRSHIFGMLVEFEQLGPGYYAFVASLGVFYLERILLSEDVELAMDLLPGILQPLTGRFLSEALWMGSEGNVRESPETSSSETWSQSEHANLGFHRYSRCAEHPSIYALGIREAPLRTLGYVFWDEQRITVPINTALLDDAFRMNWRSITLSPPYSKILECHGMNWLILSVGFRDFQQDHARIQEEERRFLIGRN
ncbi:hypothetical protein S7711_10822 [Stachybotrys chartarum IBT 7711]|uniref:Uncharacterized protein n=1 Tax=Stachybotrys chartarum (strain CBS 109288 / IBT 7711) TaxID=1280523 RepID=A0A084AJE0_STACB|nr:hypothetical protein S7711_10822 [Stachybotrys chartarum IBT 7711]